MASYVSAKQILLNYNALAPTNEEGKKVRGTAYEFQDYAYRLASDLNDLEHLPIYMKLTKSYPRYLLEKVYEFVADIAEDNKGRLFMWKFKQIKLEIDKQRQMFNFEPEFITNKIKHFRNQYSNQLILKNDSESNPLLKLLKQVDFINSKTILLVGNCSTLVPTVLTTSKNKIFGIDVSKNLTKSLKEKLNIKGLKFITKDFLKNSYKDNFFDLIIFNNYWPLIPLKQEDTYIKEAIKKLSGTGKILISTTISKQESETWEEFKDNENIIYKKLNSKKQLQDLFTTNNLKIVNEFEFNNTHFFLLCA